MVQTRFALVLYFSMVTHKTVVHTLPKAFSVSDDMVQILPILAVPFTQDSKVEDLVVWCSLRL